ncbi:MAG: glycoside hydrolase family 19 protein [Paludibacterium sp.]|uniref:glycoside hydrolase family 19 protein n=1 Tax=Paludibacterium sp. TaxID=1917523 RepID=UPI0025FC43A6|nr:glycoside hydrolase family 19 protein [Paludibacterium sp.]MBV8047896.1 glycoside hydrolase family 19 protein [Paludibacterium sp.]
MIDVTLIATGTGCTPARAAAWQPALSAACGRYQIDTPRRIAAFLSQVGVESAGLSALCENLNYSAAGLLATFPTHFDAAEAAAYARQPQKIADRVYACRMGNGDEASGDGWTYRGRGLIQITGRAGYAACGLALGLDLLAQPALLELPADAALSAAWYFASHGCLALADAGDVRGVTRAINGGLNGYAQRLALYGAAERLLNGGNHYAQMA